MKVAETMQHEVATVQSNDGLDHAAQLMSARQCGSVVVVDDQRRPVAVLTDRDICMAALRTGRRLVDTQVADAMSGEVITCSSEDAVTVAEDAMSRRQVRRLPVVDASGRLVGLIALDDLAREARADAGLLLPPVSYATVGRTLGQITRPHLITGSGGEVLR